jgi:cytochrome P450
MNRYTNDLQNLASASGLRIAFPRLTTLLSYIPLPAFRKAFDSVGRMRYYAEDSIRRYERMVAADPYNVKSTLFTKTFAAKEETMTQAEVVANAQAYIVAGSDTTAHSMTYLTWAVCRDPAIKKRLVEALGGLPDIYRDEDLKALLYLNQVIMETLRCYAAAPAGLPRDVPKTGCEIDGYWMPAGTEVMTQAYSMHRDQEVYPEPERLVNLRGIEIRMTNGMHSFNPSRWESPTKEMKESWMPFGGGARSTLSLLSLRCSPANKFLSLHRTASSSNGASHCHCKILSGVS